MASIFILGAARAKASGEILKDSFGIVRSMTHYQASGLAPETGIKERPDVCDVAGEGHLPTIRELAKESIAMGAKGILEMSQVNPDKVPAGYYKVSAINPDGQKDEFYFNDKGFKSPKGDFGNNSFWSSSIASDDSRLAYTLNGYNAQGDYDVISYRNPKNYAPVFCISGH